MVMHIPSLMHVVAEGKATDLEDVFAGNHGLVYWEDVTDAVYKINHSVDMTEQGICRPMSCVYVSHSFCGGTNLPGAIITDTFKRAQPGIPAHSEGTADERPTADGSNICNESVEAFLQFAASS